jgi:hypothetical protein
MSVPELPVIFGMMDSSGTPGFPRGNLHQMPAQEKNYSLVPDQARPPKNGFLLEKSVSRGTGTRKYDYGFATEVKFRWLSGRLDPEGKWSF